MKIQKLFTHTYKHRARLAIVFLAMFSAQVLFAQEIDTPAPETETADEESVIATETAETVPIAEPTPAPVPVPDPLPTPVDVLGIGNTIPANVSAKSGSGSGLFKPIASISLVAAGLGAVIYGIAKNGDVSRYVDDRKGKAAVDAEKSRNISYGIGTALLAGGSIIYLVF